MLGEIAGKEIPIPDLTDSLKIEVNSGLTELELRSRHLIYTALPLYYKGGLMYTYDVRNKMNTLMAAVTRIGQATPKIDCYELKMYEEFCEAFNLEYIPKCKEIKSLEYVLDRKKTYNGVRKRQIIQAHETMKLQDKSDWLHATIVDTFIKLEWYIKRSRPRLINPRSDAFKSILAPLIYAIDEILYAATKQWNVKKIDVRLRPEFLLNKFGDKPLKSSDLTAFESSIKSQIMLAGEVPLLLHMVGEIADVNDLNYIIATLVGPQLLKTQGIKFQMDAIRESGEITTSTFNYYTNLTVTLFSYYREVFPTMSMKEFIKRLPDLVDIACEGDDGLHCSEFGKISGSTYSKLGFIVKMVDEEHVSTASFCGQVFEKTTKTMFSDPIKFILKFGWVNMRYHESRTSLKVRLMVAKALSYCYTYKNCPIIYPVAYEVVMAYKCRVTVEDIKIVTNLYKLDYVNLDEMLKQPDPPEIVELVRDKFKHVYKITQGDQIKIESEFIESIRNGSFESSSFQKLIPDEFVTNYIECVRVASVGYVEHTLKDLHHFY